MFGAAVSQDRSPILPALFWGLPYAVTELCCTFVVPPCSHDGAGLGEQSLGSKIWECWVSVTGGGGAWGAPSVSFSHFLASDLFFFTRVLTPCPVSEHLPPHQSPPHREGSLISMPICFLGKSLESLCNCSIPDNYSSTICSCGLNHLWEKTV